MWWFLACLAPLTTDSDSPKTGVDPETSTGDSENTIIDPVEKLPGDCPDLYDQSLFPDFYLDISDENWQQLESNYAGGRKDYVEASFRYGQEEAPAMVRLKGNPNFSWKIGRAHV